MSGEGIVSSQGRPRRTGDRARPRRLRTDSEPGVGIADAAGPGEVLASEAVAESAGEGGGSRSNGSGRWTSRASRPVPLFRVIGDDEGVGVGVLA